MATAAEIAKKLDGLFKPGGEGYRALSGALDKACIGVEGSEKRRALPPWKQMAKTSLELTKERIPKPLANVLEKRQPKDGEVFIPQAKDIKAPTVK